MSAPIDWTKPVETLDGSPVRVLCTDGPNGSYPVVCILGDVIMIVALDGVTRTNTHTIRNVAPLSPIRQEAWLTISRNSSGLLCFSGYIHPSKAAAMMWGDGSIVTVGAICIGEWEEKP